MAQYHVGCADNSAGSFVSAIDRTGIAACHGYYKPITAQSGEELGIMNLALAWIQGQLTLIIFLMVVGFAGLIVIGLWLVCILDDIKQHLTGDEPRRIEGKQ